MKIAKLMYKCRYCGDIFADGSSPCANLPTLMYNMTIGKQDEVEGSPELMIPHCCKPGQFGVADFIGAVEK